VHFTRFSSGHFCPCRWRFKSLSTGCLLKRFNPFFGYTFIRMPCQKAMKSLKLTSRRWKRYALHNVQYHCICFTCQQLLLTEVVSYDLFHQMISVIKNLKKENEFLKGKCENSDIALVKLIEEVMCASQKLSPSCTKPGCYVETTVSTTIPACLLITVHWSPLPC